MSELKHSESCPILKGLNLLGLALSESELNELESRNYFSLANRNLSEIGSVFILAAAIAASNLGKTKKTITFGDLVKTVTESTFCSGIPIYSWNSVSAGKCCLYLSLVAGKPALLTHCESQSETESSDLVNLTAIS